MSQPNNTQGPNSVPNVGCGAFCNPHYTVQLLSDTLKLSIVKVTVTGEVSEPTLLLDAGSLVGSTLQSTLRQFGGGLPLLPDIHCLQSNKKTSPSCNQCDLQSKQPYPCGLQTYHPPQCPGQTTGGPHCPGGGNNLLKNNSSPEIAWANDLVTFSPPPVNLFVNNFNQTILENPVNSLPILYGMSGSCNDVCYALVSGDSIKEILEILNQVGVGDKLGVWKQECGPTFRFCYYGITVTTSDLLINLTVPEFLNEVSKAPVDGQLGNWVQECEFYYRFYRRNLVRWKLTMLQAGSNLETLLHTLNEIPQGTENPQFGVWRPESQCSFIFWVEMRATAVDASFPNLEAALKRDNWNIQSLEKGVFTFTQGNNLLRATPSGNRVKIVANAKSLTTFINQVVNTYGWYYSGVENYTLTQNWRVRAGRLRIWEVEKGRFQLFGDEETIQAIASANPPNWRLSEVSSEALDEVVTGLDFPTLTRNIEAKGWVISEYALGREIRKMGWTYQEKYTSCRVASKDNFLVQISPTTAAANAVPGTVIPSSISGTGGNLVQAGVPRQITPGGTLVPESNSFVTTPDVTTTTSGKVSPSDTQLIGDKQSITALLTDADLPPNTVNKQTQEPTCNVIQIIPLQNGFLKVIGEQDVLSQINQEVPFLIGPPVTQPYYVLYIYGEYTDVLERSQSGWITIQQGTNSSILGNPNNPVQYVQLIRGQSGTTVWGTPESIQAYSDFIATLRPSWRFDSCLQTSSIATVFTLTGGVIDQSTGNNTYQIIADRKVVEDIYQVVGNPSIAICEQPVLYTSLTAAVEIDTFINALLNFNYGDGVIGWRLDTLNSEQGCSQSNLYRYYIIGSGGEEVSTPYFIYLHSIKSQSSPTQNNLPAYTKIEGLKYALNNLIEPILSFYQWTSIKAGAPPKVTQPVSFTVGKVVGLTGNVLRHPNCDAPYRLALSTLNWSFNSKDDGSYVELLWETDNGNLPCGGIGPDCCCVTGDQAFVMSASGNYGESATGSSLFSFGTLVDNAGQPPIANNAFPNATGNILFRTKGSINGSFIIKVIKYSGYYNRINFFDNAANNLQSAIQANELIYRDWIRATKQRQEEGTLVPLLVNLERQNRDPLRPGPVNNNIIVHTVVGEMNFSIPIPESNSIQAKSLGNEFRVKDMQIQLEMRQLLSHLTQTDLNGITVSIISATNNPPSADESVPTRDYRLYYKINAGTALPLNALAWFPKAKVTLERVKKLNTDFGSVSQPYPTLQNAEDFQVSGSLSAFVIDQTATSKITSDIYDSIAIQLSDYYLGNLLLELDNALRDPVKPAPLAVPDLTGALQQIGGVNYANHSRWLEQQVNRLLYTSEFPMPIRFPTPEDPQYRFPDGSPVYGFWSNAFTTGQTIPINPPPPLILPDEFPTARGLFTQNQPNNFPANQTYNPAVVNQIRNDARRGFLNTGFPRGFPPPNDGHPPGQSQNQNTEEGQTPAQATVQTRSVQGPYQSSGLWNSNTRTRLRQRRITGGNMFVHQN